jgi:hypothetical protein
MATYFLRAKGARATRVAAYRAGERICDQRTSEVYDYTDRRDVAYKEVVLPADPAGRTDMAWTQVTQPSIRRSVASRAVFSSPPLTNLSRKTSWLLS